LNANWNKKLGAQKTFASLSELENEAAPFPVIYEIIGSPDALSHTARLCTPGGRIVLTGLPERDFPLLPTHIVRKELTVHVSMIYRDEFPAAVALLAGGKIDANLLISATYPLEKISRAFEDYQSPGRVKTLIQMPD
jgi:threonine dehydrogenase-like Zn-dependent dehydrogenase